MVSRKTRKRIEGGKQLVEVALRQIPGADKLYDAKEAFEGGYKLYKAKNPPLLKQVLSLGEITDREEARKERARDRRMSR